MYIFKKTEIYAKKYILRMARINNDQGAVDKLAHV